MLLFVLEMDVYYIRLRKTNHVAFVAFLLNGEECRNEERDLDDCTRNTRVISYVF